MKVRVSLLQTMKIVIVTTMKMMMLHLMLARVKLVTT